MAIDTVDLARELRVLVTGGAGRAGEVADTDEPTLSRWVVVSGLDQGGPATASDLAAAERVRPVDAATLVPVRRRRDHGTAGEAPLTAS